MPPEPTSRASARLGLPVPSLVYPAPKGVAIHALREGPTTIGRSPDNDLVIVSPSVAEHHAIVTREGEKLLLRDVGSGRPTFVNETAMLRAELKPGDVLRLGEVRIRVAFAAPSAPAQETEGKTQRFAAPNASASASGRTKALAPAALEPASTEPAGASESAIFRREGTGRRAKALAKARTLSDEVIQEEDLERLLARVAVGFIEVFEADRGVCLLLEEDGRNPLLTVERRKEGTEEGAGVAREIIERTLQARSVVRVPPPGGDKRSPGGGFAAPLIAGGKGLGLLFFERRAEAGAFDSDDVHLTAIIANLVTLAVARLLASG